MSGVPYIGSWGKPTLYQRHPPDSGQSKPCRQSCLLLRGKLPQPPVGVGMTDICFRSPTTWAWMCVLLQHWQDHSTIHLFGRQFQKQSLLSEIMIRDLNPWLVLADHLSWNMVAKEMPMWLDIQGQYTDVHQQEWQAQKQNSYAIGMLKHATEILYLGWLKDRDDEQEAVRCPRSWCAESTWKPLSGSGTLPMAGNTFEKCVPGRRRELLPPLNWANTHQTQRGQAYTLLGAKRGFTRLRLRTECVIHIWSFGNATKLCT